MIIPGIQREEAKVKKSIKEAAKKGQIDVAKILAKELVQSRKATSKLYASKAQMNSVVMSMQQQLGKGGLNKMQVLYLVRNQNAMYSHPLETQLTTGWA